MPYCKVIIIIEIKFLFMSINVLDLSQSKFNPHLVSDLG